MVLKVGKFRDELGEFLLPRTIPKVEYNKLTGQLVLCAPIPESQPSTSPFTHLPTHLFSIP
jgi:hypothetical protein